MIGLFLSFCSESDLSVTFDIRHSSEIAVTPMYSLEKELFSSSSRTAIAVQTK